MAWFPRPVRPSSALADLRGFFASGDHRHKLLFGFVAVLLPALIVMGFNHDSTPPPPQPGIVYAESWRADRTDAQIVAQQKIDSEQRAKEFEARRKSYEKVAKMLGLE